MGAISTARGQFPQWELQGSSAFALSIAHQIEATVLEGVNVNPQSRAGRESHCHQDPHFQVPGDVPTLWQKMLRGLGTQVYPEERTVNREECGLSTFSSHQNNNKQLIIIIIKKASSFICRKPFCPEKERVPPHPAESPGGGYEVKDKHLQWNQQTESKAPTARQGWHAAGPAPSLAHSRSSGKT